MGINLDGPMFATRKAVQYMLAHGGGSIVNTASTAALHGGAAGVAYTAAKHALVGLTRNTAWMYAAKGIRCNAICPGATKTNIQESMPSDRLDPTGAQRAGVSRRWSPPIWIRRISPHSRSSSPRMSRATSTARLFPPMEAGTPSNAAGFALNGYAPWPMTLERTLFLLKSRCIKMLYQWTGAYPTARTARREMSRAYAHGYGYERTRAAQGGRGHEWHGARRGDKSPQPFKAPSRAPAFQGREWTTL